MVLFTSRVRAPPQNFLNAMTYPDRTVYPVASQNLADFYHLVDVYLDAVFHPCLRPHTLLQEGWHHEIERTTDGTPGNVTIFVQILAKCGAGCQGVFWGVQCFGELPGIVCF